MTGSPGVEGAAAGAFVEFEEGVGEVEAATAAIEVGETDEDLEDIAVI